MAERIPANVYPPGEYLRDELRLRGWSVERLVVALYTYDRQVARERWRVEVDLLMSCAPGVYPSTETCSALGSVLGTSGMLWWRLGQTWVRYGPQEAPDATD